MLFVGAEIQLLDGKGLIKRSVFNLRLKVTIVSQMRISTGIEFQVVAADKRIIINNSPLVLYTLGHKK